MVVVAHSLGGLTAPLVAGLRPVDHVVLLCALLPEPGISFADQLDRDPSILGPAAGGTARDDRDRSYWPNERTAIAAFYHDCEPDLARRAYSRLRHQARKPSVEPSPLGRWPQVPITSVLCRDDRVTSPEWSRRAAHERLGVEPIELPGGHSPFLSQPGHLAELLLGVARGVG